MKAVYDVDLPNGKTIQVEGPEDATDDELIAIARTHPSLSKQSAKPPSEAPGTGMKAGQLPEMSSADQLLKEAKASTPSLQQAMPEAFKATEKTGSLPTAGGLYDLASKGDLQGAWNALPESVRDVTQYGAPAAAGALALKQAYNLYQSGKEGEAPTGIKARTIGGGNPPNNPPPPPGGGTPASTAPAPAEPSFNPKEVNIAKDIENKYGYKWKDIKSNFGLSDVTITNPLEAGMLAGAYHQQQHASAINTTPVAPATEVITPVVETPKAPAPPPVEAAKTGVAPELVEAKLGTPTKTTGSGMPAYEGQGEAGSKLKHKKGTFESLAQVPKDYVFVPGGQSMDIVRNAVGQTEYTKNLKAAGGYPASSSEAYKQSVEINKSLGRVSNTEAKSAGTYVEPTPGITKRIADSKAVRVGGVTGALILATDLASAAQEGAAAAKQGDRQMATGYLTDIIGALSGPVGYTASQLFGTSPEELRTLREAEQVRKVGAGRGIAPPSAYQR
jgi:hypothetical protein